jgi:anti-anti-sigma factor
MIRYRMTIRFSPPAEEMSAQPFQFIMETSVENEAEARRRAVTACRDLALSAGFDFAQLPLENEVNISVVKLAAEIRMELGALEISKGVYCARLVGPLDGASALRFEREAQRLKNEGAILFCLDLNHAHPVGSAGLGVLLNIHDRVEVRLVRVPPSVRKMFTVLGLDGALSFFDGFPEALAQPPRHHL